jgi:hypothetical protein
MLMLQGNKEIAEWRNREIKMTYPLPAIMA